MFPPTKKLRTESTKDSSDVKPTEMNVTARSSEEARISPFMPMFEHFRAELDEHHDRRERVIKASRDITASSKKIIFALQRMPSPAPTVLPQHIAKTTSSLYGTIHAHLLSLHKPPTSGPAVPAPQSTSSTQLPSILSSSPLHPSRYHYQLSPGLEEYFEALLFQSYLTNGRLPSLSQLTDPSSGFFPEGTGSWALETDWLGGVMDCIGEIMRWGITSLAVGREEGLAKKSPEEAMNPKAVQEDVEMGGESSTASSERVERRPKDLLNDLRTLRTHLEILDARGASPAWSLLDKKRETMRTCVEKVENAAYGVIVRGREKMGDFEDMM